MRKIIIKAGDRDVIVMSLRSHPSLTKSLAQAATYIKAMPIRADGTVHVTLPIKLADECAVALDGAPTISKLFRTGEIA